MSLRVRTRTRITQNGITHAIANPYKYLAAGARLALILGLDGRSHRRWGGQSDDHFKLHAAHIGLEGATDRDPSFYRSTHLAGFPLVPRKSPAFHFVVGPSVRAVPRWGVCGAFLAGADCDQRGLAYQCPSTRLDMANGRCPRASALRTRAANVVFCRRIRYPDYSAQFRPSSGLRTPPLADGIGAERCVAAWRIDLRARHRVVDASREIERIEHANAVAGS